MKTIGIIPARYGSQRFEGKVLADLLGKPVLQHVWERAKQSKFLEDLIIACDDERVERVAKEFGAKVVLTSKDHSSGSDRLTEVVASRDVQAVINIQGDEPLIHFSMIDDLARALTLEPICPMATLIKRIDDAKEVQNPNIVKVVIDKDKFALYFSRAPIPYNRDKVPFSETVYYKHFGLYAYTKDFLFTFKSLPKSRLEKIEQLEQLRVLEAGYKIKTVETQRNTIGVDTQEDLLKAIEFLRKEG